jgi:predicted RNA binding protein YcfA (HicA-like mRNA interferase family)
MSKSISFKQFIKAVEKLGFVKRRQVGSHIRFIHPDGRKTTIPDHGAVDVPKGLLSKIVKHDLKISIDELWKLL